MKTLMQHGDATFRREPRSRIDMRMSSLRMFRAALLFSFAVALIALPVMSGSQSLAPSVESSAPNATPNAATGHVRPDPAYDPPSEKTKLVNYAFDAFGPYPIATSAVMAGIDQYNNAPPEWKQAAAGYGKRFASDFGIAAAGTTTRYGLSEALREDTLYYRCECNRFFPRLGHALVSTLTARRGGDGHRVFSVPAIVAPYAGAMTGVFAWYPNRFGAMDAFRMGNYSLLAYAGENIGLEFFYSGPHSLLSRMHLNDRHGATDPGPNH